MAHMREIDRRCDTGCGKRAVVEVYDNRNTLMGKHCRPCGKFRTGKLDAEGR